MGLKFSNALFALAWSGKDYWPGGTVQIHEDGDVIMTTERGLIQANSGNCGQVQLGHGYTYIVFDIPPQALISNFYDSCGTGDRHLPDQGHGGLFKEQRKTAALSSPRNVHSADAVLIALDPGHIGSQVAMMLEKVEMPPGEFPEIMGLAQFAAVWAWITAASLSADANMQFMGRFLCVQPLVDDFPGLFQAKAKHQDIFCKHSRQGPPH